MDTFEHKAGGDLSLAGTVELPAGTWSATSQVRDAAGELVTSLAASLQADGDAYTLLLEATSTQTAGWTEGATLYCDVRFQDNSTPAVVLYSATFAIHVVQAITEAV